jgi:uncharacterized RDD family membrane protein YckC
MSRTVTVITPENVCVTYQIAGFISRYIAFVVDLVIQFAVLLLLDSAIAAGSGVFARVGLSIGSILEAGGIIAAFVVIFGYATLFEMLWAGRTPGKRLLGLRVIRDGGLPIDLLSSALRNIMRFVDIGLLPLSAAPIFLFGLPGILSIMCSSEYKRFGDYAAGTIVIREARSPDIMPGKGVPAPIFLAGIRPRIAQISREDFRLIRQFIARSSEMEPRVRTLIAERLFSRICRAMKIPAPAVSADQKMAAIEYVERTYAEQAGLL